MRIFFVAASLVILTAILLAACDSPPSEASAPVRGAPIHGDSGRGAAIVQKWCSNCHSAGTSANDRAPPLATLATNTFATEGAIRAFLMAPHQPMPPLPLTTQEIEDIIAYFRAFPANAAPPPPAQ